MQNTQLTLAQLKTCSSEEEEEAISPLSQKLL
jgi:hypothetical protein